MSYPRARQQGLVVAEFEDEVLIYDLTRHRAYCLNAAAARVWRACDGQTPVEGLPLGEDVARVAVARLAQCGLVDGVLVSRRALSRTVARALLPTVAVLVAPTAAMAATQECAVLGECCANFRVCRQDGPHQKCNGHECIPVP